MKAVAYIRVSTNKQDVSVQRQVDDIKAYCTFKKIDLVDVVKDEGVSGYKSNRKGFREIKKLCENGKVKMVIVYDLSRLSRSVRDTLEFIDDYVNKKGVHFVSLSQDIDTSSPTGKAFLAISAVFNQLYRDEISYKTKRAVEYMNHNAKFKGGVVPYGYDADEQGWLSPNKEEQDVIETIKQYVMEGLPFTQIAIELNSQGIKSKTGGKWHTRTVIDVYRHDHKTLLNNIKQRKAG